MEKIKIGISQKTIDREGVLNKIVRNKKPMKKEKEIIMGLVLIGLFILGWGAIKVTINNINGLRNIAIKKLAIVNISNELPHKTLIKRDSLEIDMIIIHHTETESSILDIAKYHTGKDGNNWSTIGYHYIIQKSGKIVQVNELSTLSAHAKGYNTRSIGIAINGDYTDMEPSKASIESCKYLIMKLKQELPNINKVCGHCEIRNTACPGMVQNYMQEFNNQLITKN